MDVDEARRGEEEGVGVDFETEFAGEECECC